MRPQPIILSPVDQIRHERHSARYQAFMGRRRPLRAASESIIDMTIEGYAVLYDEPMLCNGEINVIEPGAFTASLNGTSEIYLQLDHDDDRRMASTKDAVSFTDDAIGLAFVVDLEETKNGRFLKQMVDTGQRAAVSVGIKIEQDRREKMGEHTVRFISRATLKEASLVREGACKDAFAGLVNTAYSSPIAADGKSLAFTLNFTTHKLQRLNRTIAKNRDDYLSIASKLNRVERAAPRQDDEQPAEMANHFKFY